jgi:hypothetical protein
VIRYFVSYALGDTYSSGFGWMELTLTAPICDGRDIKTVVRCIEEAGNAKRVIVLNWRRFEEPES